MMVPAYSTLTGVSPIYTGETGTYLYQVYPPTYSTYRTWPSHYFAGSRAGRALERSWKRAESIGVEYADWRRAVAADEMWREVRAAPPLRKMTLQHPSPHWVARLPVPQRRAAYVARDRVRSSWRRMRRRT